MIPDPSRLFFIAFLIVSAWLAIDLWHFGVAPRLIARRRRRRG